MRVEQQEGKRGERRGKEEEDEEEEKGMDGWDPVAGSLHSPL